MSGQPRLDGLCGGGAWSRQALSRRSIMGAALLMPTVAACTEPVTAPPTPAPDPDLSLRQAGMDRELALLRAYDAAVAADPGLATSLLPLRREHATHLLLLDPTSPPATATPTSDIGRSTVSTPSSAGAPPALVTVMRALSEQERRAAAEHARDALVSSRGLAAILASLAASEASHVVALA